MGIFRVLKNSHVFVAFYEHSKGSRYPFLLMGSRHSEVDSGKRRILKTLSGSNGI